MHDAVNQMPHNLTSQVANDDVGLGEIFSALRRRVWVLIGVVLPVLALTALVLTLVTPRYTAEVLIMIESEGSNRFVSLDSVVAGLSGDAESVQSEAYVLNSRALADRVVQMLGLDRDPEFTADIDPELFGGIAYSAVLDAYLERLEVTPMQNSRVIALRFSSEGAEKSAVIANAVASEYLQSRLENKFELTNQANSWLGSRIEELRGNVARTEQAVELARGELGLLESDGSTLASQELVELNTQLVIARAERGEAEAQLQQVETLTRTDSGAATSSAVLESALIQRLREQEAEVQRNVAELSSELGEKHPRMIQLRAEAADLRDRIEGEVEKVFARLSNEVSVALARERALSVSLEEMKTRVSVSNQNEVQLRALEREADANRVLLNTLMARQKETLSQEDLSFQQPDATVFSPAITPARPSYPRKAIVLGLAFVGSMILSLLIVLLLELLDSGFRSGEQFEQYTGVASIGFVPAVRKPSEYRTLPAYVAERAMSPLGESMRTLSWSLRLAFPDKPPRTVLFTSAMPGEGKTTIASCMATAESNAGRRVLLIDADIRRPQCHELMGVDREPGLTNLLAGGASLRDVVSASEWSGLHVIPAGTGSPNAPNLLGSESMKTTLAMLVESYDLVVIDSPPVMAAADARILCKLVDATVLVARWGKTRRQNVRLAIQHLQSSEARLAGGLLSMVDPKRNARYLYGDSGVYSGDLAKYYTG